jgi:hypothetical protein
VIRRAVCPTRRRQQQLERAEVGRCLPAGV